MIFTEFSRYEQFIHRSDIIRPSNGITSIWAFIRGRKFTFYFPNHVIPTLLVTVVTLMKYDRTGSLRRRLSRSIECVSQVFAFRLGLDRKSLKIVKIYYHRSIKMSIFVCRLIRQSLIVITDQFRVNYVLSMFFEEKRTCCSILPNPVWHGQYGRFLWANLIRVKNLKCMGTKLTRRHFDKVDLLADFELIFLLIWVGNESARVSISIWHDLDNDLSSTAREHDLKSCPASFQVSFVIMTGQARINICF